jgi:outer membrane protein assembly factor BamB
MTAIHPRLFLGWLFAALFSIPAFAADWPAWRGPSGDGVCTETKLPLRWGTNENVRWRVPLPDRGNSTPVVSGDRVFITQAIEKEGRRLVMCFDRTSGKKLWESGTTYSEKEPTHETNPYCAGSPATDGERVIASFGSAGLFCYAMDGKQLWRRDFGPQRHIWGNASSPALWKDLCFLNFGPGERTFLVALNKKTGDTVWQHDEPGGKFGDAKPGEDQRSVWVGSWSTPLVIKAGAAEELIMIWPNRVASYQPPSGKENWTCRGLNPLVYASPLFADGVIVAMGGFMGSALAVKTGGSGDVTDTHRLWHRPKTRQRIGSGVIHDGHIYILNDPGIAECIDLKTGSPRWEERLKGPGAKADNWSSMVLAGERLYVINQSGDAFVVRAAPEFQVLATNSMAETTMASIAPAHGNLFIRTYKHLWCIGEN